MVEIKQYPKVVVGVFVFNDKNELFLAAHRYWNNKFTIPGGHVEIGEDFTETARREIKEETNLDIKDIEFLGFSNLNKLEGEFTGSVSHLVAFRFKAKVDGEAKVILDEENSDYKWLTIEGWLKRENEIEKLVVPMIKEYFLDSPEKGENYESKFKRALADYHNLLKQTAKEKMEFAKFANEQLLYQILPVYDNLKESLKHADEVADQNGWLDGIKHIIKQFNDVLNNLGVEEIKTIGKKFDHQQMEAVENEIIEDKKKDGLVAREVKPGYKLNGKVIVPARVVVYKIK